MKDFNPKLKQLKPLQNLLFVEVIESNTIEKKKEVEKFKEKKGEGTFSILIPKDEKEMAINVSRLHGEYGKVLRVSSAANEDYEINEGDIVLFGVAAGQDALIEGKDLRVLRGSDVLAKILKEDA